MKTLPGGISARGGRESSEPRSLQRRACTAPSNDLFTHNPSQMVMCMPCNLARAWIAHEQRMSFNPDGCRIQRGLTLSPRRTDDGAVAG